MEMNNYKAIQETLEVLIKEIEKIMNSINEDIKKALENLDYINLEILSKNANTLKEFLEEIKKIQKEWNKIHSKLSTQKGFIKKHKFTKERLKRGLRTPEKAYIKPILESLVQLGGKGKVEEILKLVKDKMDSILNKYDWEPLPSIPKVPRWKNTAQWTRNSLVKEGYLSPNSPQGIWEITDKGVELLRSLK